MMANTLRLRFQPATRLTDFLGLGYNTTGVGSGSLESLLPIYPQISLIRLASLHRRITPRAERAGDKIDDDDEEPCLTVHLFKKFSGNLPLGISLEAFITFFADLFVYDTPADKTAQREKLGVILSGGYYFILAITAPLCGAHPTNPCFTISLLPQPTFLTTSTGCSFTPLVSLTRGIQTSAP